MLAAALSISLSACGNNKHTNADGPVAVKVNGQPILAAEFGVKPGLDGAALMPSVSESDMKLMVDLELLRQAAVESKLDQDKEISDRMSKSKESPRRTLAMAYINKQMSTIAEPTEAEVSAYYNDNPAQFAERKHYELNACYIKHVAGKEAKIKAQLGKSKKFDVFERWLKANKITHGSLPVSVDTDKANEGLLKKIEAVPVGGSVVEDGKDQMTITFVSAMREDPLTLEQVKQQIMKTLFDKKKLASYRDMIKRLRDQAKIEYVPPYTENGYKAHNLSTPGEKGQ